VKEGESSHIKVYISLLLIVLVGAALTTTTGLYLRSKSSQDNCNRINQVQKILTGILQTSEKLTLEDQKLTAAERKASTEFFHGSINKLSPNKC
jgi:hypothetical protein